MDIATQLAVGQQVIAIRLIERSQPAKERQPSRLPLFKRKRGPCRLSKSESVQEQGRVAKRPCLGEYKA
jgi:hypothetical protein